MRCALLAARKASLANRANELCELREVRSFRFAPGALASRADELCEVRTPKFLVEPAIPTPPQPRSALSFIAKKEYAPT